jgi:uncharacterized membrane-anchored protein
VPEVTLSFWIIKILTTGTGESASDWLINRGEGLPWLPISWALVIDFGLFVVAFVLQFAVRRYIPAVYWFAVLAVGIVGTVVADIMHFLIGMPLSVTTGVCAAILAVDFMLWHRSEGTLSIHSIFTVRREIYYWVAVFFTFALGTALGDLTAQVWNLGYFGSIVLFAALMLVPAALHWRSSVNAVFVFWFAYVLTRPLGASIADWLSVPTNEGGLGLGSGPVTWVATGVIAALVAYVSFRPPTLPASGDTDNSR